jgi:hypothetical protein
MEDHFVNYTQALVLKELGFNEPCIATYTEGTYGKSSELQWFHQPVEDVNSDFTFVSAPLKQQVFKWFREVHKIHGSYGTTSDSREEINGYCISNFIDGNRNYLHINWEVGTYEEAESECIDRLISIIKEKKS